MEIVKSRYDHPETKSGQHTNGPESVFIRDDDTSPWYVVIGFRNLHEIRKKIDELGIVRFQVQHCEKLLD
jgi:hypothetical protein